MSYNAHKNFNSTAKDYNSFRVVHGGRNTSISGEKWSTFEHHARLAPKKAKKTKAGNDNTSATPSAA